MTHDGSPERGWRERAHEIIFEADTAPGRAFDILLLIAILASVAAVMAESIESVAEVYGRQLLWAEWGFTALFTLEYVLRLATTKRPVTYAKSFFGIVDLLSILPTYLSLLIPGAQSLLVIRALRLLRIFRVLKLARFVGESRILVDAIRASSAKVTVFIMSVVTIVLIVGAAMHLIEGPEHGFTSIPQSVYWAIVTMTTVGYGDIAPETVLGKTIASFVMIAGYGIIAVPTGIVTAELANRKPKPVTTQSCASCSFADHDVDAKFCKRCGEEL